MPRFSIIIVHCQSATPHDQFLRALACFEAQTFKDFELLVYHDGPLTDLTVTMPVPVICTEQRHKDWGHSLRDRGIRECSGEYVMTMNSDNVLYPEALEEIDKAIRRQPRIRDQNGLTYDNDTIIIFAIFMRCTQRIFFQFIGFPDHPEYTVTLTGNPPAIGYIDALQFVMRRSVWLAEGGWYDKTYNGDGNMYVKFSQKYGYRAIDKVLGEHW